MGNRWREARQLQRPDISDEFGKSQKMAFGRPSMTSGIDGGGLGITSFVMPGLEPGIHFFALPAGEGRGFSP